MINLDPANDVLPYQPDIDVSDLITITDVMEHLKLGPNGGLVCQKIFQGFLNNYMYSRSAADLIKHHDHFISHTRTFLLCSVICIYTFLEE